MTTCTGRWLECVHCIDLSGIHMSWYWLGDLYKGAEAAQSVDLTLLHKNLPPPWAEFYRKGPMPKMSYGSEGEGGIDCLFTFVQFQQSIWQASVAITTPPRVAFLSHQPSTVTAQKNNKRPLLYSEVEDGGKWEILHSHPQNRGFFICCSCQHFQHEPNEVTCRTVMSAVCPVPRMSSYQLSTRRFIIYSDSFYCDSFTKKRLKVGSSRICILVWVS